MSKIVEDLLAVAQTFSDKASQISPNEFSAFGIQVISRYGKADEIIAMLQFAQEVAASSVAHYIAQIDFDSKSSACSFELRDLSKDSEIASEILRIAYKHFYHFWWFDDEIINFGEP